MRFDEVLNTKKIRGPAFDFGLILMNLASFAAPPAFYYETTFQGISPQNYFSTMNRKAFKRGTEPQPLVLYIVFVFFPLERTPLEVRRCERRKKKQLPHLQV